MDFQEREEKEGVRWSWSMYPSSRVESQRMIVPLGCLFTPLKQVAGLPLLTYEPIRCKTCVAILNPYCQVDYRSKLWVCPFCSTRNTFPQHYADISENNLPAELYSQYTTVEYKLGQPAGSSPKVMRGMAPPPIFVYVVDICLPTAEEVEALKDSLLQSFNLLPENAQVAFITFGTTVNLHEVGESECSKTWSFRGSKEVTTQQLVEYLNPGGAALLQQQHQQAINAGQPPPAPQLQDAERFIGTMSDIEFTLTSLVDELQPDPWPVPPNSRPLRGTGAALSVAVALLESKYRGAGGRIMTFLAGPCTQGPGQTVSVDLEQSIRLHNDLKANTAPYYTKSKAFFDALLPRCVVNGHCVDALVGSLDQVGVAEMKHLVQGTGGNIVLCDSFTAPQFRGSFQKLFTAAPDGYLSMAFNAAMEVQTTPDWKISGVIGPCVSRNKRSTSVSDQECGIGGTCQWGMSALDHNTTFAMYFDMAGPLPNAPKSDHRVMQVITRYQHPCGEYRLRATTLPHRICVGEPRPADLSQAFDQEAAAVLLSRMAVFKLDTSTEHLFDVLRWMDRHLIALVRRFADYTPNDPGSLRLNPAFALFPQFCYHLRRSEFLQVFNSSPDETANFRIMLDRQTCNNCLIMIQPTLHCFSMKGPPTPALLDSQSVQPDVILLLDSFFEVVIHHGETIAAWRKANYQDQPEYEYFRQLLDAPKADAAALMKDRFPVPRLTDCDQRGSQARILYTKINPSTTHNTGAGGYGQQSGELMYTDDANLSTFQEHLKKLAVQT